VDLARDENGVWSVVPTAVERQRQPDFVEIFPRYLTSFDPLFEAAGQANEFEFLVTLLGVRGLQGPGWSAYETTLRAISKMQAVHNELADDDAARHLKLWVYGHIVEASEPYEVLANLLDIAAGGRFRVARFPAGPNGQPQSPGVKIASIARQAADNGLEDVALPLSEVWDREFRNAIFHADYALHGLEVRLTGTQRVLSGDEVELLSARAVAYHEALALLRRAHLESYRSPVVIPAQPFAPEPEKAVVIVREGAGAVGLKDALTPEERAAGGIPFRMAIGTPEELALLDSDPDRAVLPARPSPQES
jgi:hypothetical protein